MWSKKFVILVAIILFAIVYKVIPFHLFQWSATIGLCTFLGATQKMGKAVVLSLLAMLVSDCIFQLLFLAGYTPIEGFYQGQLLNYTLLIGTVLLGHLAYRKKWFVYGLTIIGSSVGFFLLSNLGVWFTGTMYPMNMQGLIQCYVMGLPFFKSGIVGDVMFGFVFFVIYSRYAVQAMSAQKCNRS